RMEPRGRLQKWLFASAFVLLAGAASAQIQPGREFQRIEPQRPVAADGRIEVIEFFYYGCPVCYETQPFLTRWLSTASEYVAIRRVPALSTEAWEPFAKLFYALETLGQIDRLHWPVYDHFHFENVKLNDEKIMADWAARNGIERDRRRARGALRAPGGGARAVRKAAGSDTGALLQLALRRVLLSSGRDRRREPAGRGG